MDNDDVISTLNDLIETCKDGEKGFRTCAEDAEKSDLPIKELFVDRAQSCATAAQELQELVRAHGGTPTASSSVSGNLHRHWLDLKTAVLGKNNEAVLNECERGEDVAVRSYRKALDKDLPVYVRSVVERQYQGVLQNHDRIKSLRDQARRTSH
jgi:uncharacterized protein (TIGR02284 family)